LSIQKKTLKKSEVSTEINMQEILGDLSKNESVRAVFFEAALGRLVDRLEQGRGVDGKLDTYSDSYKDSLAFKVFGKTNTVNMQLTGDMVAAIEELDSSGTKLKIGIKDKTESAKAFGHMTGMEGHKYLDGKVPVRNWFGWTDKELKEIANSIKPEVNKKNSISDEKALMLLDKLLNG
jgi:hypothetical protein